MRYALLTLLLASAAQAGNLSTPIAFDSAAVLPQGVRNVRINGVAAGANDKFNATGETVGTGDALNVDVSYYKLIDGKDTAVEKGIMQGFLASQGQDLNSSAGQTTGVVNVEVNAVVPIIAYGVTKDWTAALVVPFVNSRTSVDTAFASSSSLAGVAGALQAGGKAFKADEVNVKTQAAIADKVVKKGYDPLLEYEEKNMMGDIRLVNKYLLKKNEMFATAMTFDATLPTGDEVDVNKAIDVPAGDGQLDLGVGLNYELFVNRQITLVGRTAYTAQLPTRKARRIREEQNSSLSKDIDPNTKMDLGDIFYQALGGRYMTSFGLNFKGQYTFQYKMADKYSGDMYAAERYEWMGQDTDQIMHSATIGIGYSTIPLFKRKQFPVPLEFNAALSKPITGRNVTKDTVGVLETALYF
jgi:hypothetical protein